MDHKVLPTEAQAMLMRAAATRIPDGDPLARMKAINSASATIRRQYPGLFKPESEPVSADPFGHDIPKFKNL
jgi:hypothetical protein